MAFWPADSRCSICSRLSSTWLLQQAPLAQRQTTALSHEKETHHWYCLTCVLRRRVPITKASPITLPTRTAATDALPTKILASEDGKLKADHKEVREKENASWPSFRLRFAPSHFRRLLSPMASWASTKRGGTSPDIPKDRPQAADVTLTPKRAKGLLSAYGGTPSDITLSRKEAKSLLSG